MNVNFFNAGRRLAVQFLLVLLCLLSSAGTSFGQQLTQEEFDFLQSQYADFFSAMPFEVDYDGVYTMHAESMGIAPASASPHHALGEEGTKHNMPWNVKVFGVGTSWLYLSCSDLCGHANSPEYINVVMLCLLEALEVGTPQPKRIRR